jgi:two-component system, NarL family, nitrate/nitrite response regulator NarL
MRVLVVDDHALFTDAILPILERSGMEVLAVVRSGEEALAAARREHPDLVMLDLGLPDVGGIGLGARILRELPGTKVIALTGRRDPEAVQQALEAGFHGYLTKDIPMTRFAESLRAAVGGEVVVFQRPAAESRPVSIEDRNAELLSRQLTARELEVLALLVEGSDNAQIAARLSVSANTVRTHVQSILTKLGVRSRLQAAAFAVRHQVVPVNAQSGRL